MAAAHSDVWPLSLLETIGRWFINFLAHKFILRLLNYTFRMSMKGSFRWFAWLKILLATLRLRAPEISSLFLHLFSFHLIIRLEIAIQGRILRRNRKARLFISGHHQVILAVRFTTLIFNCLTHLQIVHWFSGRVQTCPLIRSINLKAFGKVMLWLTKRVIWLHLGTKISWHRHFLRRWFVFLYIRVRCIVYFVRRYYSFGRNSFFWRSNCF